MPTTTNDLAAEYGVSPRQVLNYKDQLEQHLGHSITFRQGKRHYYQDQFLPLLGKIAKGEPLPRIEQKMTTAENPFKWEESPAPIVLHTAKLAPPRPVEAVTVEVVSVDCSAIEEVSDHNVQIVGNFKSAIEAQVLGDARAFGASLRAKVRNVITKEVASAYREVIR